MTVNHYGVLVKTMNKTNKIVINEDLNFINKNCKKELNQLSGSRILFTGGAGFLGYYFIQSLLSQNNNSNKKITIDVYDNYLRGNKLWIKKLASENKNLKLIKKDISKKFLILKSYDYIIHAASIASPTYYRIYPLQTIDANINGIRNILDNSVKMKSLKGLIFFSSSEIYGDPDKNNIPTNENYRGFVSCVGPRACYDESKRLGETLCNVFYNQYNIPVKIVRPFNNYGPGLDINDKRVVPDLCKNILENKNLTLFSDGEAKRTYCYITDAICGYIKVLVNGKNGNAYNIGMDRPEISVIQLAKKIEKIAKKNYGFNKKIIFKKNSDKNYLVDNPQRRCPDLSKSFRDLSYNPQIDLEKGLANTLSWYKEMANEG